MKLVNSIKKHEVVTGYKNLDASHDVERTGEHKKTLAQRRTFISFQKGKQENRRSEIIKSIEAIKKNKKNFEYVTDLAKEVAKMVSAAEGGQCSHTTLLRNNIYREIIYRFFEDLNCTQDVHAAYGNIKEKGQNASLEENGRLREEIRLAQNEIERLKIFIKNQSGGTDLNSIEKVLVGDGSITNEEMRKRAEHLEKLLIEVVSAMGGIISIEKNGDVVDKSRRNLIIGSIHHGNK